jgi:hypothetical protein
MAQVLSLAGAALVLLGFGALHTGRLSQHDVAYHVVNLIGAVCLASSSLMTQTWGFVILNAVWAAVAASGLLRPQRDGRPGSDPST